MTTFRRRLLFLLLIAPLAAVLVGCGQPPPATPATTGPPPPPPPPPAPTPEVKPAPPPAKAEPDPYEAISDEVSKSLDRYVAVFAEIRDEAGAEKAATEISKLSARMRELALEMAKVRYRPEQEKWALRMNTQLAKMADPAQTPEIQRVLTDPEMTLIMLPVSQSFMLSLATIPQAEQARRLGTAIVPQTAPPAKQ